MSTLIVALALLGSLVGGAVSAAEPGDGATEPGWVMEDGFGENRATIPLVLTQTLSDGGFEAGFQNPFWSWSSTTAPGVICSIAICGTGSNTAMPRSGTWWAWMGGAIGSNTSVVSQSLKIPRGEAGLEFYLWMGLVASPVSFTVEIDGDVVFEASHLDIGTYGGAYQRVEVDVSGKADGKTHELTFTSSYASALNNLSLDDVSLIVDEVFIDDNGSIFEADIEWLAAEGITKGCNPPTNDRFCPDGFVTRGQMAAFLVRALGYTDDGGGDLFVDDDGSTFEADIDRLGTAGVTKGCNPPTNDRFCPDGFVTRGQMAAFLRRALGP